MTNENSESFNYDFGLSFEDNFLKYFENVEKTRSKKEKKYSLKKDTDNQILRISAQGNNPSDGVKKILLGDLEKFHNIALRNLEKNEELSTIQLYKRKETLINKKEKLLTKISNLKFDQSGTANLPLGNNTFDSTEEHKKEKTDAAAITIQAGIRGLQARKAAAIEKEKQAAIKIQAFYRGRMARKKFAIEQDKEAAATKIQKAWKTKKEQAATSLIGSVKISTKSKNVDAQELYDNIKKELEDIHGAQNSDLQNAVTKKFDFEANDEEKTLTVNFVNSDSQPGQEEHNVAPSNGQIIQVDNDRKEVEIKAGQENCSMDYFKSSLESTLKGFNNTNIGNNDLQVEINLKDPFNVQTAQSDIKFLKSLESQFSGNTDNFPKIILKDGHSPPQEFDSPDQIKTLIDQINNKNTRDQRKRNNGMPLSSVKFKSSQQNSDFNSDPKLSMGPR